MNSWQLTVLGSTASIPSPGESTSALHLGGKKTSVLIDAGGNIPRLMADCGLNFRNITEIFLSHSHPDHIYGVPFLSHCFYDGPGEVICRAPEETVVQLKNILQQFQLLNKPDKYLTFKFMTIPTKQIESFELDRAIEITTVPTRHSRPGCGYLIKGPHQRIFYTADTADNQLLRTAGINCDVMLIYCQSTAAYKRFFKDSHCSAEEVGKIAQDLKVKVVVPFHLNTTEFPVGWKELCSEIRTNFQGTIIKPQRGMAFTL